MKTKNTLIAALLSLFTLYINYSKGQIPNAGFESWTNVGTYEDPKDYLTFNSLLVALGGSANVTKTTDKHSGTYAIRLESSSFVGFAGTYTGGGGGFEYYQRPAKMQCYYKFTFNGNDSATIVVGLSHWNSSTNMREDVGVGAFVISNTISNYTLADINIDYLSSAMPDTATINLLVGNALNLTGGSVLYVDDLAFTGITTNTSENASFNKILVYPNPAVNELNFKTSLSNSSETHLIIYDITGRKLDDVSIKNELTKIQTTNYAAGIYFYQMINKDDNSIISTGKFNVMKSK